MKPFLPTQFKLAFAIAIFFLLQSCHQVIPGSRKNELISSGMRSDFHDLNTEAMGYLKADDAISLNRVFSKEMIEKNNAHLIEQISEELKDHSYKLLDEYYLVHKIKDTDSVNSVGGDINRYGLAYPYITTEMYCAYFVPEKSDNKYMISLIYGKYDYGWKIDKMDLAPYTVNGKTGPELFALAKAQYAKKYLQAAVNNIMLAEICFEPGLYWKYADEFEAGMFNTKLQTELNEKYRFPFVLKDVVTGPMILRVYDDQNDEGSYPMIYYMTHFPLKDTSAVKKENIAVQKAVSKLFPGLDENNKYILYSAFNVRPSGYTTVDHFDMKIKAH